jgi:SAM-dependent methyltransferase
MKEGRPNPWLSIPAADYEGHMGSPGVGQLQFLSRVFGELLAESDPASLAVLGCATGNGFAHVRPERVRRLVGLDINCEYIEVCRERYAARIPGLELVCADLASFELEPASMDLVHAALFLEYVDPAAVLEKASRWLRPRGLLSVVLQRPSAKSGTVSETGYTSLKILEPVINLVAPEDLAGLAGQYGFLEVRSKNVTLESGKSFFVGVYRLEESRA